MTDLAVPPKRSPRIARPPVGLLLSVGAPKPERGPGRPIDYIRPKEGKLAQFQAEATKFAEVYGDQPKSLDDVYFLVDDVPTVLQIRLTAFSETGIRAIGQTNYAELPADEFLQRAWSYDDDVLFFPKDVSEVRPELRESWEGAPIPGHLDGWDDPRRESIGFKLSASLEFCLPRVMGVGKVARISTSSRNSIRNLYAALWDEWEFFGRRLVGLPFRLALRPKPTQRFDKNRKDKDGKPIGAGFVSTTVYELVVDTPYTVEEIYESIKKHRREIGAPDVARTALEGRRLTATLALPAPDESAQTRDEPEPEMPGDALLNRIYRLEDEAREAGMMRGTLQGVFGVESVAELVAEDAERYAAMLERALPAEEVEGELVPDSEDLAGEPDEPQLPLVGSAEDDQPRAGADEPSPAEEEEPEPGDDPILELADASATLIPEGRYKGQRLDAVAPRWLDWALKRDPAKWKPYFLAALELYVRERQPDIWREVRG